MKKILLSFFSLLFGLVTNAQIVNGNLELWANGEPSNWLNIFEGFPNPIPGTNNDVTQIGEGDPATTLQITGAAAAGGSGSSALLETKAAVGPKLLALGKNTLTGMLTGKWPFTGKPSSVVFDFIAQPKSGDTAIVYITLYDASYNIVYLTGGYWTSDLASSSWKKIELPFQSYGTNTKPVAFIEILAYSSTSNPVVGSKLYLDNFELLYDNTAEVNTLDNETKIYPNPVTDVLNIDLADEIQSVSITSMDGKLVFKGNTSVINTSKFISGMYVYEIVTTSGKITKGTFAKN
jgi:hypothetical protein